MRNKKRTTWKHDPWKTRDDGFLYGIDDGSARREAGVGRAGAEPAARLADPHSCEHGQGSLLPVAYVFYAVDHRQVMRLGDLGLCGSPADMIIEGAATFTVCGLPVARKDDGMEHGGVILDGSPNLRIGGPSFGLPENLRFEGSPRFRSKTIRDLYFLSTTPTGGKILDRLAAAKQPVTFRENTQMNAGAKATPVDKPKMRRGDPSGTVVEYDPDFDHAWTTGEDGPINIPAQVGLAHELIHAVHVAEGTCPGDDSEKHKWEEASTCGYPLNEEDQKAFDAHMEARARAKRRRHPPEPSPTENDVRRDLGLPTCQVRERHQLRGCDPGFPTRGVQLTPSHARPRHVPV